MFFAVLNNKVYWPSSFTPEQIATGVTIETKVIVLLHGLTSALQTFINVSQQIADLTNVPVCAMDLRGHGGSPEVPLEDLNGFADYRIRMMASDIAETLWVDKKSEKALKIKDAEDGRPGKCQPFVYVLSHSWGSRVALQFAAQYYTRILGCYVEDEIIGPDLKKGPPIDDQDKIDAHYKELKDKWDKYAPHQFNSEEEVAQFYETVAGPPKTFGFPNYSRKIASRQIEEDSNHNNSSSSTSVSDVAAAGTKKTKTIYFPLFKPHVAFAFDEFARVADMNGIWKDPKQYPFLIHICCGDGEENGADVSKEEYDKLLRQATVEMAGHRRSVSLIAGSGHVIHRDYQDLFLMDFQQFVAKANG